MNNDLKLEEKRLIFQFRTRMLNFGENYRGSQVSIACPLCESHPDSQYMTLKCPIIRAAIKNENREIDDNFEENILDDSIGRETIETLKLILEIRGKK